MIARINLLLIAAALLLGSAGRAADSRTGRVPGQFIVKLKEHTDPSGLRRALGANERLARVASIEPDPRLKGAEVWERFYVYRSDRAATTVADVVAALGKDNIEYVEPEYYLEFFGWPTDALFDQQWYLYNSGQDYMGIERVAGFGNDFRVIKSGTAGSDIRLTNQFNNPPAESTRVVVSIVDSGIDPTHPQLQNRLWHNEDEIPDNGVDDDHNGYIDDVIGYDVSGDVIDIFSPQGDPHPVDTFGHGTHIAGIIGAEADNDGVVGICPWAELMAVKITPNGISSVGAAGIVYAVNAGAQVINISWGTPFEASILEEALHFAEQNGVLLCIAPGNTGDNSRFFPAAFDSVTSIVVAAGNSDGYQTDFSTFGAHIDLVAPGLDILSLRAAGTDMYASVGEPEIRIIDDMYYLSDGTSMATPMVVGAAAMILSFRPDLSLYELEDILLQGAIDLVDPWNTGDSLPGPDTISGHGYLNIDSSLALLERGSMHIVEPARRSRQTDAFTIRIAPVGGYTGTWQLDYSIDPGLPAWQLVASGSSPPPDSVAAVFDDPSTEGIIYFRLTDQYGSVQQINITYVRQNRVDIQSPVAGAELNYSIPIVGSAYGPDYDSMAIFARRAGAAQPEQIMFSTGEFFDSLMLGWTISGGDTGSYDIHLVGYFGLDSIADDVSVRVVSAFATGFPQPLGDRCSLTPICCDLNRDGLKEIAVGTRNGLILFHGYNGEMVDGWPALPGEDMRSVPAVYDIDGDGEDELICTNDLGVHAFNYDGTYVEGNWPIAGIPTGMIPYEYAYPNPVIVQLREPTTEGRGIPDSAIIFINKIGEVMAFRFNGEYYKNSPVMAEMDPRLSDFVASGGGTSPFVTALDLGEYDPCPDTAADPEQCDPTYEVVASYTSPSPYTGLGLFQGANGHPKYGDDPVIQIMRGVLGTVLADITGDLIPDIISAGVDPDRTPTIWVKTLGNQDVAGWPAIMPDVTAWIGSYPTAADLDLDGIPEILITFFEYDISALYIWRADGTPYLDHPSLPPGQAFVDQVTFGTPVVANLLGDEFPEIIFRSGYLLPGTGPERVYILDYTAVPVPGWPLATPTRHGRVFSSRYAPLVDDIDNDGLVELVLISDSDDLLAWDFDAPVDNGRNTGRFLMDNRNSGILPPRVPTAVDDHRPDLPTEIALDQNFPNPFNPDTRIRFELPARAPVLLEVYNILGRKVTTLINRELPAGRHEVDFDGHGLATGVYFYRLKIGETVETRKMMMLK